MKRLPIGTLVRISESASVPPLMRGLYAEVMGYHPNWSRGTRLYRVLIHNWNLAFNDWLDEAQMELLEPDAAARLMYVLREDGNLPGWVEAVDYLQRVWTNWARLWQKWNGVPDTKSLWTARGLDDVLQAAPPSYHERAKVLWQHLLASLNALAQVAAAWV